MLLDARGCFGLDLDPGGVVFADPGDVVRKHGVVVERPLKVVGALLGVGSPQHANNVVGLAVDVEANQLGTHRSLELDEVDGVLDVDFVVKALECDVRVRVAVLGRNHDGTIDHQAVLLVDLELGLVQVLLPYVASNQQDISHSSPQLVVWVAKRV